MAINVELRSSFKGTAVFFSIISLGAFAIGVLLMAVPKYPALVDDEGMTLRNGKRVKWADLSAVRLRPAGVLWLEFGKEKAIIAPGSIDPAEEVVAFVKAKTAHLL